MSVIDVPSHHWWCRILEAREEHGRAGRAHDAARGKVPEERLERNRQGFRRRAHRVGTAVPDVHRGVDDRSEHEWHVATLGDLGEIGREERGIDDEEEPRDGERPLPRPAPHLDHGDVEQNRRHEHGGGDGNAVGGGEALRCLEHQRQRDRYDHEQPVHGADVDLPVAFAARLRHVHALHPAEADRLPRHGKGPRHERLAGDDGGERGEDHHGHDQRGRAQAVEHVLVDDARRENVRGLPEIAEQQAREDDVAPCHADGVRAEMPHVGIERLGAGHREADAAEPVSYTHLDVYKRQHKAIGWLP